MKKAGSTYCSSFKRSNRALRHNHLGASVPLVLGLFIAFAIGACSKLKEDNDGVERQPIARVQNTFLYKDELTGIIPSGTSAQDSTERVEAYIESWIRKQLLIDEATRRMDINEAEIERKILDYRYSIIAYEYQTFFIKQNLDTAVDPGAIEQYYRANIDNFVLKQNIVQASFIKVPKTAPRTEKIKEMMFSKRDRDERELKSYCLSFAAAYHLTDSSWMIFDDLVRNSPLAEIPNKIQFLKSTPYYETSDDSYLYYLKVDRYAITDNISPLEFVRKDIKNIILNKRKVELAKRLEDDVYKQAENSNRFEIYK